MAKSKNKLIATDVHVLSNIDDDYNRQFMEYADILFLSDENIPYSKHDFIRNLGARYHNSVIILGMGASGALLHLPHHNILVEKPAFRIDNVVNTVGAGDALFSAYLHYHLKGYSPEDALDRAQLFAALKIRAKGAAEGFVTEDEIEEKLKSAAR
jgi:ribokinase